MKHYIIITDTKESKIDSFILDSISKHLEINIGRKISFKELSKKKAYECECAEVGMNKKLKTWIQNFIFSKNIDCNFVFTLKDRNKKLLLADMDSTIIKEESLDELGKLIGKKKQIVKITENAMNGTMDFEKALIKRVAMLKGQSTTILDILKERININPGAKELVKTMTANGSKTVLVSGGFTFLTDHLQNILGFSHAHGNSLEVKHKEGEISKLSGKVEGCILDKNSKLNFLEMYIKKYRLTHADTICVGDGANDIEMIKKASFGVSFNGKKILDQEANIHFKHTNLMGLLYIQGYTDKEIID
ncbi:phosphoserine phosphatase SerB [Alphaproteobacteria bacterium]|nr:phosphoserine phosphatase SerB [Alphaproteobacteria bacterium]MDC1022931.1 phosphoserine phosphatase SerB [Alphaproteobacteria bacterium]